MPRAREHESIVSEARERARVKLATESVKSGTEGRGARVTDLSPVLWRVTAARLSSGPELLAVLTQPVNPNFNIKAGNQQSQGIGPSTHLT